MLGPGTSWTLKVAWCSTPLPLLREPRVASGAAGAGRALSDSCCAMALACVFLRASLFSLQASDCWVGAAVTGEGVAVGRLAWPMSPPPLLPPCRMSKARSARLPAWGGAAAVAAVCRGAAVCDAPPAVIAAAAAAALLPCVLVAFWLQVVERGGIWALGEGQGAAALTLEASTG